MRIPMTHQKQVEAGFWDGGKDKTLWFLGMCRRMQ